MSADPGDPPLGARQGGTTTGEEASAEVADAKTRVWTDGTAQADRRPRALDEGYFEVDELELADLIAISARYAKNLPLDPTSEDSGSWSDLLRDSPASALAEISRLSVSRLAGSLRALSESQDHEQRNKVRAEVTATLKSWHRALGDSNEHEIESFTNTLNGIIRELDSTEATVGASLETGHRLLQSITELHEASGDLLLRTLKGGGHDPALGLLFAFLRLFQRAQERINEFSRRRLEFYLLDVLGFEERARTADQAHITLTLAPDVRSKVIPAGTEFSAGRDQTKKDLVFLSERDVRVTDARVEAIATLHFQRDELISPEVELDFVTGIRAHMVARDEFDLTGQVDAPLFRRSRGEGVSVTGAETNFGFAVASPILDLREGRREVHFDIELAVPPTDEISRCTEQCSTACGRGFTSRHECQLDHQVERLLRATEASAFFRQLGQLTTYWLVSSGPQLSENAPSRTQILNKAKQLLGRDDHGSAEVIEKLLSRDRGVVFHDLFEDAFDIRYSGEEGWHDATGYRVELLDSGAGLSITVELGPEAPAIVPYDQEVHGGAFDTELPIVGFRVNSAAIFHPYSFLRPLDLGKVTVRVDVTGVTDLVAHNQIGPVDVRKPCQPFGPLPTLDSYLVLGSFEAARKKLTEARLEIEWGELPRDQGGWRQYYAAYEHEVSSDTFRVDVSVMRNRRWESPPTKTSTSRALFGPDGVEGPIAKGKTLKLDVMSLFQPLSSNVAEEDFRADMRPHDGMFRLSLGASDSDFGHREYPLLLARILSTNANPKVKHKTATPNPPYTPLINGLSLSYKAESRVKIGAGQPDAGRTGEKILHEHPFGAEDLAMASLDRRFSLMPGGPRANSGADRHEREGYLLLGLSATVIDGPLSLLVQMVSDATLRSAESALHADWFYLASNEWHAFEPQHVRDDSTRGLTMSGIVTVDIPVDIDGSNTILPPDLYWLAIGVDDLESFVGRLHSVSTGAIKVRWEDRGNVRPPASTTMEAGRISAPLTPLVGLEAVNQVAASFGGKPEEDYDRLVTRASERLRHKNRAVTPWDFERLVLENFPYIQKVKCFPALSVHNHLEPAPGSVLIVVVPRLSEPTREDNAMPLISGSVLGHMQQRLQAVAPRSARITVRNAAYEEVQIRCQVRLTPGRDRGVTIRRVNQALIDFIAPWDHDGRGGQFGWSIGHQEVAGYIHEIPGVDFVTDLSLLHITEDQDKLERAARYRLRDTARHWESGRSRTTPDLDDGGGALSGMHVSGRYPWSLAVPSRQHFIRPTRVTEPVPARITGVGELEIGRTFIIVEDPDAQKA